MSAEDERRNKPEKEDASSFEEALAALEKLVERLENGEVPLDKLVVDYEKGSELLKICEKRLQQAELRIEKLKAQGSSIETEPFAAEAG